VISVIIPALNEEATILDCLESLAAQSIPRTAYEIIVVDGGSSDRTREYARLVADQVIPQKRAGIGGARGDGARAANGDILVFTDADTHHPPSWLETIQELLTVGGYDVCTGPVRFYNPTFCSYLVRGWRQYYLLSPLFGFYWLIGSNFAVKKMRTSGRAVTGIYLSWRIMTSPCASPIFMPNAPMTVASWPLPPHVG